VKLDTVYAGALGAAVLAQKALAGEELAEKLKPGRAPATVAAIVN
jgi:hypothetical protein